MTDTTAHTRGGSGAKGAALAALLLAALPLHVEIYNATGETLECQALAAHWYTLPAQSVANGGTVVVTLSHDPRTGEVMSGDLAIERLFCGHAGAAWATRSELDLARLAASGTSHVTCAGRADVQCHEDKPAEETP